MVPLVIRAIKFCDPEPVIIFDYGFRPSPAHRRTDQHQVFDLVGLRALRYLFIGDDCVGNAEQLSKVERFVEVPLRGRRLWTQPESERTGAVVGRVEQVI